MPCLRLKTLKTIPCSAAHTRIGQIRECPTRGIIISKKAPPTPTPPQRRRTSPDIQNRGRLKEIEATTHRFEFVSSHSPDTCLSGFAKRYLWEFLQYSHLRLVYFTIFLCYDNLSTQIL